MCWVTSWGKECSCVDVGKWTCRCGRHYLGNHKRWPGNSEEHIDGMVEVGGIKKGPGGHLVSCTTVLSAMMKKW